MKGRTAGTVTVGWLPLCGGQGGLNASVTEVLPTVVSGPALVLCEPYGMEGLAADDAFNALAEILVARGHPVLRFRPPGSGDASDLASEDSILDTWIASVEAAIEQAKTLTTEHGVYLLGLRLGATIAATVCELRTDVAGLVLWAPVSGRVFLREQRLIRSSASRTTQPTEADVRSGCIEAAGFRMSAASISALGSLDLLSLRQIPSNRVLIIDRDDVPSTRPLVEHLESLDSSSAGSVITGHWRGYSELRLDTPDEGTVPTAMFGSIADWLDNADAPHANLTVCAETREASVTAPTPTLTLNNGVTERVLTIGTTNGAELHAIVTEPSNEHKCAGLPIMVMLSTGGNPCSGAGRVHAELARGWAKVGFTSLRIDRRGVGVTALRTHINVTIYHKHDAAHPPSDLSCVHAFDRIGPYADEHLLDLIEIERFVHSHFGDRGYVLIGICSGGYASFHSARTGVRPIAMVSVNQMIFDPLEFAVHDANNTESPVFAIKARYELTKAMKHPSAWIPILKGEVPIRPAVRRLISYVHLRSAANKSVGNHGVNPLDVNYQMDQMANLGIKQVYLFDEAETGLAYLRFRAQETMRSLANNRMLRMSTVEAAGHTFGTAKSRAWLGEAVLESLSDLGAISSVAKSNDKGPNEL